jgi:hypothetical protein
MKKYQKVLEEYLLDPQICKFCSNKNRIYKDYFVPLNVIRYIDKVIWMILKYTRQKTKFKFSLNDYPDEFDFTLIERYIGIHQVIKQ